MQSKKVPLGSPERSGVITLDPRPDLADDHGLWESLLAAAAEAYGEESEIYGVLHGLRCGGARLTRDAKTGLRMLPGQWRPAEYEEMRAKHLKPRAEEIRRLFLEAAAKPPPAPRRVPPLKGWPEECVAAERKCGWPGRLYPLLKQRVQTTKGPGRLLQVFSTRVTVVLDGAKECEFMRPEEVLGPAGAAGTTKLERSEVA